ncbi:hypothetical protein [Paracoccus albus]|uniref:hypothetical protein n=1 Tax=Paracoccus albus TaxID=3017784 RepID=UPI0022F0493A|nr:hypothetical protein [Paracoccus albus]WBU62005.1 hypothetical protein PAF20_09750 [Paracoccus albus]
MNASQDICRELRLSRTTVRKVIRSDATEFTYDRTMQLRPEIYPWRSDLDENESWRFKSQA